MNEYKTLNYIQTHLITWGEPFNCNGSDVVVCISGNPGVPDFYIEFGSEIHKSTGLPVCIVGQAGHEEVPDKSSNILENQTHLFNLKGQREHKFDLLSNHIDKKSKLHLIGHSIGAWLIVEILESNKNMIDRVSSINILFPTLQRMAETRSGKYLNGILRRLHMFVLLLFTLAFCIPESIRLILVRMYLKLNSLPSHYSQRILKFLNPRVGEKVLFLAYDEMDTVTSLNIEAIDKIKHLTNVIYGSNDGWAPLTFMDELKTFQPYLQMKQVNIEHAFVLRSSEEVAGMVAEFIKTKT